MSTGEKVRGGIRMYEPSSVAYCMDCMEYMKTLPDNAFDLAVVDPPYGIGASNCTRGGEKYGKSVAPSKIYGCKTWDDSSPDEGYFEQLFRVSKNQIIFGANHFISKIPFDSSCWIVWDKETGNNRYADCELAWTSFDKAVRKYTFQWMGMLQGNMRDKEERFHPTQKPSALYRWIYKNFAKQGDKILDTHLGSGSSRIAAWDAGLDFVGTEIDETYFKLQEERFKKHIQQPRLEQMAIQQAEQGSLL